MPRMIFILLAFVLALCMLAGCSSDSTNPVTPSETQNQTNLPLIDTSDGENSRSYLGSWSVEFDTEALTATVVQNREMNLHYNITPYVMPVIAVNHYDPLGQIIDIDVSITNTAGFSAWDVRLIIMTDNLGHKLMNPNSWTALYDQPGGLPINPFMAYAKNVPNREFMSMASHQVNAAIHLPGGNPNVTFAFDASLGTNCMEPYEFINFKQVHLYDQPGSTAQITVDIYDWQNNAGTCYLYCPAITGANLTWFQIIGQPTWGATICNSQAASAGFYNGYLVASSPMSMGIDLYSEVGIAVSLPGNHTWSRSWGGTSDDRGNDVAVDGNGNIYVTGCFQGAVDFDPGVGTDTRNAASSADIFLSKFDSTGIYQGAVTLGGWSYEESLAVAVDSNNDVWITGYFSGTMDFDPSVGNALLTSVGGNDAFLAKYDSNLNYLWAGSWGGGDLFGDTGVALVIDSSNNVYVTGEFHSTVDFDPGAGTFNMSAGTNAAVYLNKIDSAGNFQWAKAWCTETHPAVGGMGTGVGIDTSNNVYVLGNFSGTADLDPGGAVDMHTSTGATFDSFICKLQSNANFNWAKSWDAYSRGIVVDSFGDSYTTGNYENVVDFDPNAGIMQLTSNGLWDVFLTKLDTNGNHSWALGWGGPVNDWGTAIDINGNTGYLCVTGNFDLVVDFNPGPDFFPLPSKGGMDIFLSQIDTSSNFVCVQTIGDAGDDRACGVSGYYANQCLVTGEYSGTVNFNFLPPADPQTSNGMHDIFLTTF